MTFELNTVLRRSESISWTRPEDRHMSRQIKKGDFMKFLCAILLILSTIQSFAGECFNLSANGKTWEEKPFTLCVEQNTEGTSEYRLTLSKDKKNIAVYYLNSLPSLADSRAFGVSAMSASMVDESVSISIGYGEVSIGGGKYFYKE